MNSERKGKQNYNERKIKKKKSQNSVKLTRQSKSNSKSSKKHFTNSLTNFKEGQHARKQSEQKMKELNAVNDQYLLTKVYYANNSLKTHSKQFNQHQANKLKKNRFNNTSKSSQKNHQSVYMRKNPKAINFLLSPKNVKQNKKVQSSKNSLSQKQNASQNKQYASIHNNKRTKTKDNVLNNIVKQVKQSNQNKQGKNINFFKNKHKNQQKKLGSPESNRNSNKRFSLQVKPLRPITQQVLLTYNIYIQSVKFQNLDPTNKDKVLQQKIVNTRHTRNKSKNMPKVQKTLKIISNVQKKQCDWSRLNSQQLSSMVMNL